MQGPLSNYASGATLIFTKPFKVGDIIEVAGVQGEVADMTLPRTELTAMDGSKIIVPNKHIVGEVIRNYSNFRRLEIAVGVAYDADVTRAIKIIEKIIQEQEHLASDKPVRVGIKEFGDSSINLLTYVFVPQVHLGEVRFEINRRILEEFRREKISIPFPQRDIHIYQH